MGGSAPAETCFRELHECRAERDGLRQVRRAQGECTETTRALCQSFSLRYSKNVKSGTGIYLSRFGGLDITEPPQNPYLGAFQPSRAWRSPFVSFRVPKIAAKEGVHLAEPHLDHLKWEVKPENIIPELSIFGGGKCPHLLFAVILGM